MSLPYVLREEIILNQMDEYESKFNHDVLIVYQHKDTIPIVNTTPKQCEVRLWAKTPKGETLINDVVSEIQEYFDTHQYALFDKRVVQTTYVDNDNVDQTRLYYIASPELVKTIEDNRDYYLYNDWVMKNRPKFKKKTLRDISRYYSSTALDSTARTYYRQWIKNHYLTHLAKFKSFQQALAWLTTRSLCLVEEEAPTMIKSLEVEVARSIWSNLMQHLSLPTKGKTIPTYQNFLRNH